MPIDYRIYHPDTDGKTKNDHFQEMFQQASTVKQIKARTILFDSWYSSVDNLKLIHRADWSFFTTLKSNRMVSPNRETGYEHLDALNFWGPAATAGLLVKLKQVPFLVRLFKIVAPKGDIDWLITNDLGDKITCFVAENRNAVRWQIEDFDRSFKQLTGSQPHRRTGCQCRNAQAQRNHLACCYHAWVSLQMKARQVMKTMYQVHTDLLSSYLKIELANPHIQAI